MMASVSSVMSRSAQRFRLVNSNTSLGLEPDGEEASRVDMIAGCVELASTKSGVEFVKVGGTWAVELEEECTSVPPAVAVEDEGTG